MRTNLLRWGIKEVCLPSPVFTADHHQQQLRLVLQETKLADELDSNYSNPFSELYVLEQQRQRRDDTRAQALELKRVLTRQLLHKSKQYSS